MTKTTEAVDRNAMLHALIRPMPVAKFVVDHSFAHLESALVAFDKNWGLNLTPDFQRGHVWTQHQQERFMEAVIRGQLTEASLVIQFNAPHFEVMNYEGDLPREMQCIDGLQRLTAVRRFMAGEIKAFGLTRQDLDGTDFSMKRMIFRLRIAVHTMRTRSEVLQYYLDLNTAGTPHAQSEIERVQALLAQAVDPDGDEPASGPACSAG